MKSIPVTFELNGKEYNGTFEQVNGAAATLWNLMVDRYYWGQLFIRQNGDFAFYGNKPGADDLTGYFESYLIAWYG